MLSGGHGVLSHVEGPREERTGLRVLHLLRHQNVQREWMQQARNRGEWGWEVGVEMGVGGV